MAALGEMTVKVKPVIDQDALDQLADEWLDALADRVAERLAARQQSA